MKRFVFPWVLGGLITLATPIFADTTTNRVDPLCSDAELWSGKLITDICWSCLFPIRAAGASLGGGNVPSIATDEKFCFCTDSMNIPELGMTMGLWNPARLIEIVRNPWCSPALGGHKFSASNVRLIATTGKADFDASEMSFFNYHYFAFPLTILLDLFWDGRCNSDGYRDFDLLYVSELDPTWNSDLLAFFTSPETALFANPVAISACVADAAAAATGNPLDALFWCAGAWGHMYPLSGISPTSYGTDPRITSLLATRATASLHRRGLAWKTSGNDALCGGYIYPFIPKSQYRLSMFYPVAETDSNHAIGETTFKWGAGRTYPGPGEDHLYLLWRWQDCCGAVMGVRALFEPQRCLTQILSAILCVSLAWTPFGVSWADAIQAAGRDGQQLGQQVLGGFAFPLDTGNGTLTLNPGTTQESDISIGTLFPDANSTSTTPQDFADLYGNNPGTLAAGLDAQTALNGETSFTGEAYRTLIDNAHQSHPDLHADPIWQNGDQVFADFTPWAQSFSDCTTTTSQTETQQSVRVPDYQLCLRQPTVPQSCTANHQVNVQPLIRFVSGDGGFSSCGPGCMDLYVGRVGDDYWESDCGLFTWQVKYEVLHPEAITSATLEYVKYDDHTRVYYDNQLIYTGSSGWFGDCELYTSWNEYPNTNVLYAFNSSGIKVFKEETRVSGRGEGYSRIRLRYDLSKLITQDEWSWSGPNCQNLANAITDGICQAGSQLSCTNDPANASGCYVDPTSQVMVCGSDLAQAPVASSTGIRNTCMSIQAAGNCDLNQYGQCWTDTAGTHCLEPPANGIPNKTCASLETQGCSFIKSQCTSVLASGTCWDSVDTYDCGQTVGIPGIQTNTQQQCAGPIRCMGEDCISVNRTQSQDFSKAVALLNSAQQMAMDLHCDYANADLHQKDPTTCQVFQGKPASCKMVGGALSLVDCCETPSGAMGLGRYIDLLIATSQMDSAVMAMDSTSAIRGAWETMRTPFTLAGDAWNSFQADFASTVNDLVGTDMLSTSDIASQGLLDSLKGELMKSVAEWIGQTFGEAAGNALFSAGGQAAFDAAGNLTPAAQSGGVQLGGGAAVAGQLLSTLMTAYTVVMIIIMIIQIVYSCEEPEYELAAKKQLKVCTDLGTYCESKVAGVCWVRKESYCCYNSPLARILNEQIKPQLDIDFGTPESPSCTGIKVADLDRVDWTQVNLDEWLAILAQTGHLPSAANAASMLNLDQLTGTGSRLNPQKYGAASSGRQDTLTRTQGRMTDLDVPTVKRQSELEGWGMGPQ